MPRFFSVVKAAKMLKKRHDDQDDTSGDHSIPGTSLLPSIPTAPPLPLGNLPGPSSIVPSLPGGISQKDRVLPHGYHEFQPGLITTPKDSLHRSQTDVPFLCSITYTYSIKFSINGIADMDLRCLFPHVTDLIASRSTICKEHQRIVLALIWLSGVKLHPAIVDNGRGQEGYISGKITLDVLTVNPDLMCYIHTDFPFIHYKMPYCLRAHVAVGSMRGKHAANMSGELMRHYPDGFLSEYINFAPVKGPDGYGLCFYTGKWDTGSESH
nr:TPA_asm: hypothetical protein [Schistorhabdovirus]